MNVIVAGSRDLTWDPHRAVVATAMREWSVANGPITTVFSGDCKGADLIGERIARANGREVRIFLAAWEEYGRSAGPRRNQEMVDAADGLVVVRYADSRGSVDVLRKAQTKGIPIVDVVLERPK